MATLDASFLIDDPDAEEALSLFDDPSEMAGSDSEYQVYEGEEEEGEDSFVSTFDEQLVQFGFTADQEVPSDQLESFVGFYLEEIVRILIVDHELDEHQAREKGLMWIERRVMKLLRMTPRMIETAFLNYVEFLNARLADSEAAADSGPVFDAMDVESLGGNGGVEVLVFQRDLRNALDEARGRFRRGTRFDGVWGSVWEGIQSGLSEEDLIAFVQGDGATRRRAQDKIAEVRRFLREDPVFQGVLGAEA